jgi:alpha-L-arabinofuranosidase
VQKLFSINKGNKVLPILAEGVAIEGKNGLYTSAVRDDKDGSYIVKLVNSTAEERPIEIVLEGVSKIGTSASLTILRSDQTDAVNSFDSPRWISPIEKTMPLKGKKLTTTLAPMSLTVIKIPGK